MPYRFLEDVATADIAFEATGQTLEELFAAAADATMYCMAENLEAIDKKKEIYVKLKEESLEMLLYKFLQELIFYKDAQELLLRPATLKIENKKGKWHLAGSLRGERIDPRRHQLNVDVKAITMHRFSIEETEKGWKASVIVDI